MAAVRINPDRVARAEAAGWRAYYSRDWIGMLRLLLKLNREQFQMPRFASLVAAYYTVQASRHWMPPRVAPERVLYFLTRFYGQARAHAGLEFDPRRAACLELAYWDIARRYREGAPRQQFVGALRDLHATVFGIAGGPAEESAEWRVRAAELVDEITQHRAEDPERSWFLIEDRLKRCYRSIVRAMQSS
ncbi:MAG TPA: hypothetical protein VKX16_17920 [Chloroflexota bacterium]|nr:hypothetical protein [Chloroflexota bacterium]